MKAAGTHLHQLQLLLQPGTLAVQPRGLRLIRSLQQADETAGAKLYRSWQAGSISAFKPLATATCICNPLILRAYLLAPQLVLP